MLGGILPLMQRHLRRALEIRDRIRVNEETVHLIIAGAVGVIGGVTNLMFYAFLEVVMWITLHGSGDVVEIASVMSWWGRLMTPAVGGLVAGLVLFWGLRLG